MCNTCTISGVSTHCEFTSDRQSCLTLPAFIQSLLLHCFRAVTPHQQVLEHLHPLWPHLVHSLSALSVRRIHDVDVTLSQMWTLGWQQREQTVRELSTA